MTPTPCVSPLQFCSTIVLIFFLELAVAVLAFLFQDWVRDRFREFFESNIRSYRDDIDLQNLIDSLQKAVSTMPAFSLIELGCPGFSLCARLRAQAGGEHGTLLPQLCPQHSFSRCAHKSVLCLLQRVLEGQEEPALL